RFKLVTNSRNYTAFLMAAVNALRKGGEGRQIHFYTVTPAGPLSLVNWPEDDDIPGVGSVRMHRGAHFISTYMLFIRDVVREKNITHRRWIWTETSSPISDKYRRFGGWKHYERTKDPYDGKENNFVIGIPL